jgi:hypothetical protein
MTSQFKSPLASFRQERFAQELAMGRSQGDASLPAGTPREDDASAWR